MTKLRSRSRRLLAQLMISALVFLQVMVSWPHTAAAASSTLVISEVQYGGSGSGTASVEFVELYNKSGSAIDISALPLRLHVRNGSGTDAHKALTLIRTTVPAGGYYLLVNENASSALVAAADATYVDSGTTLVSNGGVYISDSASNDVSLAIDLVGWNAQPAPGFEGAPVIGFDAGESIERLPGGINGNATDTDVNAADFVVRAVAGPQNSLSGTQPSAPLAPTLQTAVAGDQSVTLTWTTSEGAKDYIVYQDGVALSPISGTSTTLTGLTNGTVYTFEVAARNLFNMEGGKSNSLTATPDQGTVVTPTPIDASIVYKKDGVAATHVGVTSLTAEVTVPAGTLVGGDAPTITFARPGLAPVTAALIAVSGDTVWSATYAVAKASSSTSDGTVSVSLATTSGKTFAITTGSSFTVDTTVQSPLITVTSRCSAEQDSFRGTTDSDVTQVYIYRAPSATLGDLVAVASVTNGQMADVFIGDNTFGTLYLVAQDATGNRSDVVAVTNDITAPDQPQVQVEAQDGLLVVTWPEVAGASAYTIRWQSQGGSVEERVVTGTRHDLVVANGVAYTVSVASRDASCNVSAFTSVSATPRSQAVTALAGRGGNPDDQAAWETALFTESMQIALTKDGEAEEKKSPYSLEEDKDQNGIRDAEEDKNGNGIKDGEEGQENKNDDEKSTGVDRSRLIVTIAILLILAGAAIAAYSWYQGDETKRPKKAAPSPAPVEKKDAPVAEKKTEAVETPAERTEQKETNRGGGGGQRKGKSKRKTRW